MRKAAHYKSEGANIRCGLCPHNCLIRPDMTGLCRARLNCDGTLYALNYSACTSYALDPIEKKPLFHFFPGANILSVGSWGCNFTCRFCQNWSIAQGKPQAVSFTPDQAVQLAIEAGEQNVGIAYTYSEPSVWFEYVFDTSVAAKQAGLHNVIVTNGFINVRPLQELLPYVDAMNIDVKAFTEDFYRKMCAGTLADVMRTVETASRDCHVEVTTLVIPDMNDTEEEIERLAKWLAGINPDIPLHLSRYFPHYQMKLPPTPLETLRRASATASQYLHYVYMGNAGGEGSNTYCTNCGSLVIDRAKRLSRLGIKNCCTECGSQIPVVGEILY